MHEFSRAFFISAKAQPMQNFSWDPNMGFWNGIPPGIPGRVFPSVFQHIYCCTIGTAEADLFESGNVWKE